MVYLETKRDDRLQKLIHKLSPTENRRKGKLTTTCKSGIKRAMYKINLNPVDQDERR